MDQLAAAAGVSPSTLYKLFGTRRALLAEMDSDPPPTAAERLVVSAAELLAERGITGLSVEDAAGRAGVPRATAYRLFPGRGPLFKEVVAAFLPFEGGTALLRSMWDRPPGEVLPALAAMAADLDRVQLAVWRAVVFERGGGTDEASALSVEMAGLLAAYISRQMSAGRLRRMDPLLATVAFLGPIVLYLMTRDQVDEELLGDTAEAIEELVALWLRSMRPETAGRSSGRG